MEQRNPAAILLETAGAYIVSRCLHVVTDLGVADALDDTPCSAATLAAATGADPHALGRVLHLLATHGIFSEDGERFTHSPASRLLRSDAPQSMRAFVRQVGSQLNWASYAELDYTLRTGRPATEKVLPDGRWAHYQQHPEEASIFNEGMEAKAQAQVAGVLAAYDFTGFGCIADIGGGCGQLLSAVLDATPAATGILFDLPQAIEEAASVASDRLRLQAGDFFKDDVPVCDAYLLMEIIHDWDDEAAAAILVALRRSAPPHARLLLIERMMPTAPGPHWTKMLDIQMLALFGGRQRTLQEYQALLEAAGFAFQRAIETSGDITIIEAVPD